jgi:hypothetical protein
MHLRRETVTVTTATGGAATEYTLKVTGRVLSIRYVKTDFANGSTMTVTGEDTGIAIWAESNVDASATRCPRQATHSTVGAAALYAATGTAVNDYIYICNERIKIVIAAGGDGKVGTFIFTIG